MNTWKYKSETENEKIWSKYPTAMADENRSTMKSEKKQKKIKPKATALVYKLRI